MSVRKVEAMHAHTTLTHTTSHTHARARTHRFSHCVSSSSLARAGGRGGRGEREEELASWRVERSRCVWEREERAKEKKKETEH